METQHYLVSTRKYGPQSFDITVRQEHITTTLKNSINKKINSNAIQIHIEFNVTINPNAPTYMTSSKIYQKLKTINPYI